MTKEAWPWMARVKVQAAGIGAIDPAYKAYKAPEFSLFAEADIRALNTSKAAVTAPNS